MVSKEQQTTGWTFNTFALQGMVILLELQAGMPFTLPLQMTCECFLNISLVGLMAPRGVSAEWGNP